MSKNQAELQTEMHEAIVQAIVACKAGDGVVIRLEDDTVISLKPSATNTLSHITFGRMYVIRTRVEGIKKDSIQSLDLLASLAHLRRNVLGTKIKEWEILSPDNYPSVLDARMRVWYQAQGYKPVTDSHQAIAFIEQWEDEHQSEYVADSGLHVWDEEKGEWQEWEDDDGMDIHEYMDWVADIDSKDKPEADILVNPI